MKLETSRLVIRSLSSDDAGDYAPIVGDPQVTQYLLNSAPRSYKQARDEIVRFVRAEEANGVSAYAVELRRNNAFIGVCGFKIIAERLGFGVRLSPNCWGVGYATEAAQAVMAYGFEQLGLERVHAGVHPHNAASLKIIAKLGFVEEPGSAEHVTRWFVKAAEPR